MGKKQTNKEVVEKEMDVTKKTSNIENANLPDVEIPVDGEYSLAVLEEAKKLARFNMSTVDEVLNEIVEKLELETVQLDTISNIRQNVANELLATTADRLQKQQENATRQFATGNLFK